MSFVSWPFLQLWHVFCGSGEEKETRGRLLYFISITSCSNKSSRLLPIKKRDRPPRQQDLWAFGNLTERNTQTTKEQCCPSPLLTWEVKPAISKRSNKGLVKTVNTKVWQSRCLLVRKLFSLAAISNNKKIKSHYQYLWQTMWGWNSVSQTHSTPKQTHKQSLDKWHINSTFTQHFKQRVQGKADCVRNQNLYKICLDWRASDNTNTHISCWKTSKGERSYPKHVQCSDQIRSAFIFPLVFGTVLTGCQRRVLLMKTIFTHK